MLSPLVRQALLTEHRRAFILQRLFRDGAPGFEFTDLDHAKVWGNAGLKLPYQASDALAAVTASGQTVGALLDKSGALALGSELVVSPYGGAAGANWTINPASVVRVAGVSSGNALVTLASALVVGRRYLVRMDVAGMAGDTSGFRLPAAPGLAYQLTADGSYAFVVEAGAATAQLLIGAWTSSSGAAVLTNISVREIAGNQASQSSSSARPSYTVSGVQRWLALDGTDDALLTTLSGAAEMTLAFCGRFTANGQVMIGASGAGAQRCQIGISSSGGGGGLLAAGWGNSSINVHFGGPVITNTDVVGLMRANASTVELWLNDARVLSAVAAGLGDTATPLMLGCNNNNGTPANLSSGRLHRAVAVQRWIPDRFVVPLMRLLGAGIVN